MAYKCTLPFPCRLSRCLLHGFGCSTGFPSCLIAKMPPVGCVASGSNSVMCICQGLRAARVAARSLGSRLCSCPKKYCASLAFNVGPICCRCVMLPHSIRRWGESDTGLGCGGPGCLASPTRWPPYLVDHVLVGMCLPMWAWSQTKKLGPRVGRESFPKWRKTRLDFGYHVLVGKCFPM